MNILNMRNNAPLEISLVIMTGLGKFIMVDLLNLKIYFIFIACVFWIMYVIIRTRANPKILSIWGFTVKNFSQCLKSILPIAVVSVATFAIYGFLKDTLILSWHIIPILILYPIWGTIQQFLIISLFAGNLKEMGFRWMTNTLIIILTAILFAIVHYPSWMLVGGTFIMALFYTYLFLKFRNIWALGIFHGWLGAFFYYFALNRDPLIEMINSI